MSKPRNHGAGFKARVALEALKGERTVSEPAANYGVHPTMIHPRKMALLERASDIFGRGGKRKAEIDEDKFEMPPRRDRFNLVIAKSATWILSSAHIDP